LAGGAVPRYRRAVGRVRGGTAGPIGLSPAGVPVRAAGSRAVPVRAAVVTRVV